MQELEGRLGTRLLHRTTRRVAPTQDGAAFYERCLRLIADVEDAEALFRAAPSQAIGRLRVDMPGRIGRLIVAPALPGFLDRYPGIEIEIGMTDRAVNLVEDGADCVLRVGAQSDPGLTARPLGTLALINVASPAYLARHGTPRTPRDLDEHWSIAYASPSTGRVEPWEWLEAGGLHRMAVRSRVTVNSAEGSIACCLAGLGLIQIPEFDVRRHIEAGELVEIMPDHRAEPMPMALLYLPRRHLLRRLQVFVAWLETLLQAAILR